MSQLLKVSSRSNPHSVAGAIAGILRGADACELQVVGAGAVNQAVKALAIARTYLVEDNLDMVCAPYFAEIEIDGDARTAIRLGVQRVALGAAPTRLAVAAPEAPRLRDSVPETGLFDEAPVRDLRET